jgi:sirohydrochlorin ferrochelatase
MTMYTLLIAAHGTRSEAGHQTISDLVEAVRAARPDIRVEVGYLDVLTPTFPDALAGLDGPVVVVPGLLSVGYHVTHDIPAAVGSRSDVRVTRHLGPSPLLTRALAARLREAGSSGAVTLVATGSSDPLAASETDQAAWLLSHALRRPVTARALTDDSPIDGDAAAYLLAEGVFYDKATRLTTGVISRPLGVHPAVVELIWQRYDEAGQS